MHTKKKLLFIFGTRPEAIKLASLIIHFKKAANAFDIKICITSQHREMLEQVNSFFKIKPDYDLEIMTNNQSLVYTTTECLNRLEKVIDDSHPDLIFVQGDTTSAFVGALAGFYKRIKIAHIEAGLRSLNKYSPFPEEMNRVLVGHLCDYHFAPTERAKENLYREGIKDNVYVVGNTGIDSLFLTIDIIKNENLEDLIQKKFTYLNKKKLILVTAHRRESFGEEFENICHSLKEIANKYKDVEIVYPVHLNPNVRVPVFDILDRIENVNLIEPVIYPELIYLMKRSYLILTDSGGIQEEAPSLGKPVLVMRQVTERKEGIEGGTAKLVGTNKSKIVEEAERLLEDEGEYISMANAINPYGDGKTSQRIVKIIKEERWL